MLRLIWKGHTGCWKWSFNFWTSYPIRKTILPKVIIRWKNYIPFVTFFTKKNQKVLIKIDEMADVFLNLANFAHYAFFTLAPASSYALNLKPLSKVSNVSWTFQLSNEMLGSSFERKFRNDKLRIKEFLKILFVVRLEPATSLFLTRSLSQICYLGYSYKLKENKSICMFCPFVALCMDSYLWHCIPVWIQFQCHNGQNENELRDGCLKRFD